MFSYIFTRVWRGVKARGASVISELNIEVISREVHKGPGLTAGRYLPSELRFKSTCIQDCFRPEGPMTELSRAIDSEFFAQHQAAVRGLRGAWSGPTAELSIAKMIRYEQWLLEILQGINRMNSIYAEWYHRHRILRATVITPEDLENHKIGVANLERRIQEEPLAAAGLSLRLAAQKELYRLWRNEGVAAMQIYFHALQDLVAALPFWPVPPAAIVPA